MASYKKIIKLVSVVLSLCFLFACPIKVSANSVWDYDSVEIGSRLGDLFRNKKDDKEKERLTLCPGGFAFGIKIEGSGVKVVTSLNESRDGLIADDKITKINGEEVFSCEDVKRILDSKKGESLVIDIIRDGSESTLTISRSSSLNTNGLGVMLSDTASGIGTVTYFNPKTGEFGGLGHGITDGKEILPMTQGIVTGVIIAGAKKGASGVPGELRGVLTERQAGILSQNTECGVFGTINDMEVLEKNISAPIPIAFKDEVRTGEATIISTVKNGKCSEYKIRITDIDHSGSKTKSFKIKVEDESLLALTGGIVRGMSGSPIIQDGKLVGAVTHVMVANPTEGYGIFIENMLNAANNQSQQKAA